ncbi:hypothetical protein BJG93_18125 [Paraburkholderia sprentiae WSM5005]|uniref:Uncharacterized protein n=1 Tax=Paraburkholderia sprentiae WSM5005 TaxID=754502 RepID=A0A1I9YM92_9BURK|nr:hypothetical protein [Paraburkholderia sprentiae]APA87425.2 hypothetical protein BJG93_18125 [Paraburkholderia sprentiae WSM5005]
MSLMDYTDRFVTNLLAGGLVTCWTMSVVSYFDWFDDGVAGMTPEVTQLCLVVLLTSVVLFVLPWLWRISMRAARTSRLGVQPHAGAWGGRASGAALGLVAAVSIVAQLR